MSATEFTFSKRDFEQVRQSLLLKTGIRLADSKDAMVYSRLARRLRALGLRSFRDYLRFLESHPQEQQAFIDALTTNLTAFFREQHHFHLLRDYVAKKPQGRIWCCASSTGEEPYSIAITVADTLGKFSDDYQIIATDIDSQALSKARAGIYAAESINKLPPEYKKRYFFNGRNQYAGRVKVVPELQRMVSFASLNLCSENWAVEGPFDIIFCRNVMIYFDKQTQIKILSRLVKLLRSDGFYIAGHSENFNAANDLVKLVGKTVYRPVAGATNGN